jgi:hypothetical protein
MRTKPFRMFQELVLGLVSFSIFCGLLWELFRFLLWLF